MFIHDVHDRACCYRELINNMVVWCNLTQSVSVLELLLLPQSWLFSNTSTNSKADLLYLFSIFSYIYWNILETHYYLLYFFFLTVALSPTYFFFLIRWKLLLVTFLIKALCTYDFPKSVNCYYRNNNITMSVLTIINPEPGTTFRAIVMEQ